jgi:hypothetical protein
MHILGVTGGDNWLVEVYDCQMSMAVGAYNRDGLAEESIGKAEACVNLLQLHPFMPICKRLTVQLK